MASFSSFKSTAIATSNETAGVSTGVTVYASRDTLPTDGNSEGDQAYVTGNNRLYIWNGSGWYNVALLNVAPAISSVQDSDGGTTPFTLSKTGVVTTITITAADSDGDPITYSSTADAGFNGLATLSQDSSVFTITPLSQDSATTESGTITFTATDGVNVASSGVQTFTLSFVPNMSTTVLTQSLNLPSNAHAHAKFGSDVVVGEDQIFIGAYYWDYPPYRDQSGAYFIYDRDSASAGTFTYKQYITINANDVRLGERETGSLDDASGTFIGGTRFYSSNRGRAYSWRKGLNDSWGYDQLLGTGGSNERFGCATAIGGNAAVIGASGANSSAGNARVLTRDSANGQFDTVNYQTLAPSDLLANDFFGGKLDITSSGSYIVVSAKYHNNPTDDEGALYIFQSTDSDYIQVAKIDDWPGKSTNDFLGGENVHIDSTPSGITITANQTGGEILVWTGSGSTWTHQQTFEATTNNTASNLGLSGDYILAGSYSAGSNTGEAFLFERNADSFAQLVELVPDSVSVEQRFAISGDFNRTTGITVVGAYDADANGNENEGMAFVFHAQS